MQALVPALISISEELWVIYMSIKCHRLLPAAASLFIRLLNYG